MLILYVPLVTEGLKSNCRLTAPRIGKYVALTVACVKFIREVI